MDAKQFFEANLNVFVDENEDREIEDEQFIVWEELQQIAVQYQDLNFQLGYYSLVVTGSIADLFNFSTEEPNLWCCAVEERHSKHYGVGRDGIEVGELSFTFC
jgi:hypothetical protein